MSVCTMWCRERDVTMLVLCDVERERCHYVSTMWCRERERCHYVSTM